MYQSDLKHPDATLEGQLHKLYNLSRDKKIDLSFRPPYLELLEKLGQPQEHLPPVIHVAGTNGKGSTIAILRAVLEAAGYKVHAYTSPHLMRFNERIILGGREIDDAALKGLIDEILILNNDNDTTFFEITTAIAFAAFARTPADICLLEVGLGGRLDCTNIITDPLITIITSIGMDHSEQLGDTLDKIATEKAGIMKKGVPCIIGQQSPKAIEAGVIKIFENTAGALNAPLHIINSHEGSEYKTLALKGSHQRANMAAALKAIECISEDFSLTPEHIQTGLMNVHWPARLQRLDNQHFNLPPGWELYLDGGHNEDAGRAIANHAQQWNIENPKPLHIILAMLEGKDALAYSAPLSPYTETLSLVGIPGEPRAQTPSDLHKSLPKGHIFNTYQEALSHITQYSNTPGRILIAGSLYLAGHVLKDASKLAHT